MRGNKKGRKSGRRNAIAPNEDKIPEVSVPPPSPTTSDQFRRQQAEESEKQALLLIEEDNARTSLSNTEGNHRAHLARIMLQAQYKPGLHYPEPDYVKDTAKRVKKFNQLRARFAKEDQKAATVNANAETSSPAPQETTNVKTLSVVQAGLFSTKPAEPAPATSAPTSSSHRDEKVPGWWSSWW